jgi:hypothetical protein
MLANHKQGTVLINGHTKVIEKGTFHTSEVKLSKRWSVNVTIQSLGKTAKI